ncbi:hypothetical protein L596_029901 [Steinernema carpocapsae]|uniref:Uncharacterized protein n=1 Tax=Steinernema carpocapsae TaxID=34508 RepID=A0A4U5LR61_STECR|nr:hypothetical protein L596_029901 [Steinernema carpocapsae]
MQCKEKLIDRLERLVTLDESRLNLASLNKTKLHNTILQKYLLFAQILRLSDEKIQIDPSPANKLVFLQISQIFAHFFVKEFSTLPSFVFKKWHQKLLYFATTPDNANLHFYSGHLNYNRQFLFDKRKSTVENLKLQIMIEQETSAQNAIIELELPEIEEEHELNMSVDTACLIIQKIERIHQAKSRRRYLQEVKQKAIGIYERKEAFNPEKAIVRIQAITRGYLTRKETRKLREEEHAVLGFSTKGFLTFLNKPRMAPKLTKVYVRPDQCDLKKTLSEVLEFLRSNYFITEKDEDESGDGTIRTNFSENAEQNFQTLVSLGLACSPEIDIFGLTSINVTVKSAVKSSHSIIFDLRSLLLATVAIPHALSSFPNSTYKRINVIFVGRSKSGRSSWSEAISAFCKATLIRINKQSFVKKFIGRQKICQRILQFVRDDGYSVVEFDNLEQFKVSSHSLKL